VKKRRDPGFRPLHARKTRTGCIRRGEVNRYGMTPMGLSTSRGRRSDPGWLWITLIIRTGPSVPIAPGQCRPVPFLGSNLQGD
jgi:hypothetical protein